MADSMLDIFNSDAFSYLSLTTAINKLPPIHTKLGDMGLFKQSSIPTATATVEENQGKLSLVASAPRGTRTNEMQREKRKLRAFPVPHLPEYDSVKADEVLGIREFGSEGSNGSDANAMLSGLKTIASLVNNRLQRMKDSLEATKEWQRCGAIQGIVYEPDGASVIYDWFAEFGITEESFEFDFSNSPTEDVKVTAQRIYRAMGFSLGRTPFTGVQAICGDNFWDAFIQCESVKEAYRYAQNTMLQTQQRNGFMFADIMWINYTARIGSTDLIPTGVARFIPIGAGDTMQEIYAPADFVEAVNTPGLPYYAKQERMQFDKGIDMHAQSNPLIMCNRPACLKKGTIKA